MDAVGLVVAGNCQLVTRKGAQHNKDREPLTVWWTFIDLEAAIEGRNWFDVIARVRCKILGSM
jgi:hypothetical protein